MQAALWFLSISILVVTYLCESRELFTTKLAHRWFLFIFSTLSFHQWARGMGWKLSLLHLAAILLIIKSDSSKPNPAATFLLLSTIMSKTVLSLNQQPGAFKRPSAVLLWLSPCLATARFYPLILPQQKSGKVS